MKNALSRFFSVRGQSKILRSDQGTNFTATNKELNFEELSSAVKERGCSWIFNPPTASHFEGVCERKIGLIKKHLDASILLSGSRLLTYDDLNTFMQEAAAIVNSCMKVLRSS